MIFCSPNEAAISRSAVRHELFIACCAAVATVGSSPQTAATGRMIGEAPAPVLSNWNKSYFFTPNKYVEPTTIDEIQAVRRVRWPQALWESASSRRAKFDQAAMEPHIQTVEMQQCSDTQPMSTPFMLLTLQHDPPQWQGWCLYSAVAHIFEPRNRPLCRVDSCCNAPCCRSHTPDHPACIILTHVNRPVSNTSPNPRLDPYVGLTLLSRLALQIVRDTGNYPSPVIALGSQHTVNQVHGHLITAVWHDQPFLPHGPKVLQMQMGTLCHVDHRSSWPLSWGSRCCTRA